jgi:hypothetical protein
VESVRRHFVDLLSAEQVRVLGDIAETVTVHLGSLQDGQAGSDANPRGTS